MDPERLSDPTDQKIVSILRYGKKRQKEIIELIDKNENTIRNHLQYLTENFDVIRKEENGGVFYYLERQGEEIIQPQPFADREEVYKIIYEMKAYLDLIDDGQDINLNKNSFLELTIDLESISRDRYYVLDSRKNIASFFDIFDHIIELLDECDPNKHTLKHSEGIPNFFMATSSIYDNWRKGKENERFHKLLSNRAQQMQSLFDNCPPRIINGLHSLLFQIDIREGQKALIKFMNSENYSREDMLDYAFLAYSSENKMDVLFEDINTAKKKADSSRKQELNDLKDEIKRIYIREK